jgi:hypothetical protein
MKFVVPKKDIKEAIATAKHCIPEKPIVEVDSHVRFELSGKTLTISATDGMIAARVEIQVDTQDTLSAEFPVDPKRFEKAITKNEESEEITLQWLGEEKGLRIYTKEGSKSFITLPVMPLRKMAKFPASSNYVADEKGEVPCELLAEIFGFLVPYFPAPREDGKSFDLGVISKGVAYACNGINKRGYLVSPKLKPFTGLCVHKKYATKLSKLFKAVKEKNFELSHDKNRVVFSSEGLNFTVMKSRKDPSDIQTSYIKREGPYCKISKAALIKSIDRSTIASFEKVGHPIGLKLKLTGEAEGGVLETQLVTNTESDTVDEIACPRFEDGAEEVDHVIDYKIFKGIINSLGTVDTVKLYINDPTLKYFKAYSTREVADCKFTSVGVGAYSRITR